MSTAGVNVRLDLSELNKLGARWEDAVEWMRSDTEGAKKAAFRGAQVLVGRVREHILDTSMGRGRKTGALARSFREEVKVDRRGMTIAAVSDVAYAGIQDRGGIIKPKNVKRLAIPLIDMSIGKWPRHWPKKELFRRGNALSRRIGKGKNARIENVYALAKQVTISPKRYLDKASKDAMPEVMAIIAQSLSKELEP